MGRILQRIVLPLVDAPLDVGYLPADGEHGVAEAVQLALVLRLGRLDHQRVGHRKGDSWGVEAVVLQALRNVHRLHAGGLLQVARVEDELVGDGAVLAAHSTL